LWVARAAQVSAELVRSDPEAIAQDAGLFEAGVARGRPVYLRRCASCHGAGGKGDRTLGAPDLTDRDWLYGHGRVSDIEKVIAHGIRAPDRRGWNLAVMPAYGQLVPSATERVPPLSPDEIAAVTDYLLVLEHRPADAAQAAAGARIYAGKGGCFDCHTPDAKGDPAIGAPNLTDRVWLYGDGGPTAIAYSITHGRQGLCPAWAGRLSPLRIREAALYVYALSHRAPRSKVR
jgi:cytochrome c oxidase cbb3-type subunit 3